MAFTYHPPTRSECLVCNNLIQHDEHPLIENDKGKASSANVFPIHNWYNFVLGYSPEFPNHVLKREKISNSDLVIDPFMGSGTTLVCCKLQGIPSKGIDANDFMYEAARVKLNWNLDTNLLRRLRDDILETCSFIYNKFKWDDKYEAFAVQPMLRENDPNEKKSYSIYVQQNRPTMLESKYISDKPFAKAKIIHDAINIVINPSPEKEIFNLALTSILIPISNVRYGPGFGVVKPKEDVDVFQMFLSKVNRMITDLDDLDGTQKCTPSETILGDTRHLSKYFNFNSASLMITSPPYPGDHEYTKHTRLELIFSGKATSKKEFQVIKRRLLQASTTNIYHDLNDSECVLDMASIRDITSSIQDRLIHDKATSGFERLYTKLVTEYFGGMYKCLEQCYMVLKPGGKIALLVSDSHAFKMVHIQTAEILKGIGCSLGYINPEIILWQLKTSTSHKYYLRENILLLSKPK